jgi:hypothetical protein
VTAGRWCRRNGLAGDGDMDGVVPRAARAPSVAINPAAAITVARVFSRPRAGFLRSHG